MNKWDEITIKIRTQKITLKIALLIFDKPSQQTKPYPQGVNWEKQIISILVHFLEIFVWKREKARENRRKRKINSLLPPTYNSIIEETFLYHHTWFKKSFQCTVGSFCNFCIDHVFSLLWIFCKVPLIGFGAEIALDLCSIWRS